MLFIQDICAACANVNYSMKKHVPAFVLANIKKYEKDILAEFAKLVSAEHYAISGYENSCAGLQRRIALSTHRCFKRTIVYALV